MERKEKKKKKGPTVSFRKVAAPSGKNLEDEKIGFFFFYSFQCCSDARPKWGNLMATRDVGQRSTKLDVDANSE